MSDRYARQMELVKEGRCMDCAEPRDGKSKRHCVACLEKRGRWAKSRTSRKLKAGLCCYNGCNVHLFSRSFCQKHAAIFNEQARRRRQRRKESDP